MVQKDTGSNPDWPESIGNLSVNPAVNGYKVKRKAMIRKWLPFLIQGRIRQRKKRVVLRSSIYFWPLTPTAPTVPRLRETFTFC